MHPSEQLYIYKFVFHFSCSFFLVFLHFKSFYVCSIRLFGIVFFSFMFVSNWVFFFLIYSIYIDLNIIKFFSMKTKMNKIVLNMPKRNVHFCVGDAFNEITSWNQIKLAFCVKAICNWNKFMMSFMSITAFAWYSII